MGLSSALEYQFRIERPADDPCLWEARQVAYYLPFRWCPRREIIAYHWHPHVEGIAYPHRHASSGAVSVDVLARAGLSAQTSALRTGPAGAHLATGQISLESVLWLAIAQSGRGTTAAQLITRAVRARACLSVYSATSNRNSISTAQPSGSSFTPIATRAWRPASPKISASRSLAPLTTAGCWLKPAALAT